MGKITLDKILETISRPKAAYFYVLIIVVMTVLPYLLPPHLPICISPETVEWYETMEALGPGDVILFSWEIAPATMLVEADFVIPTYKHLFMKPGLKIVFVSIRNPPAIPVLEDVWGGEWSSGGLHAKEGKYGEEYVFLGFLPGLDVATAALAEDIWGACGGVDYYGNSFEDLPIMADIRDWRDIDLIIETGNVEEGPWLRQWTIPHGSRLAELTSLSAYAWMLPWYEVGLVETMLAGVRAGAEYEQLLGMPGHAMMTMDVLSVGAVVFLAAIIIANLTYHVRRYMEVKK